jgi:hypothetical protein
MPSTEAAAEGTRLHEVAARLLSTPSHDCSDEDWKQVGAYVTAMRETAAQMGSGLRVEKRVTWNGINGSVDAGVYSSQTQFIADLKTGFRPVEVEENWQLLIYAMAEWKPGVRQTLRIVQPNGYHRDGVVRDWEVPDLEPYRDSVCAAMAEAREAPKLVATPANCTYCRAVTSCPAARSVTLGGMDLALKDTGKLPAEAIRSELVTLRTASRLIETRLDALTAEADARMRAGESLSGCVLRPGGASPLVWTADPAQIRSTADLMGINPVKEKLLTPKQLIEAGVPEKTVATMATRREPRMTVQTDADEQLVKAFEC